jgi:NAD(P)H-dependent FMN reductase
LVRADAYIEVTPEYKKSYTATLQNFINHFPRQQKKIYGVAPATNSGM